MVKRIIWPFNFGDFVRDCGHLNATGVGAYFLLLGHYWSRGSLPDDDAQLCTIARLQWNQWQRLRPQLALLFQDGWKHQRVEDDIKRHGAYRDRQRNKALQRWNDNVANPEPVRTDHTYSRQAKPLNRNAAHNAAAMPRQCLPYNSIDRVFTDLQTPPNGDNVDNPAVSKHTAAGTIGNRRPGLPSIHKPNGTSAPRAVRRAQHAWECDLRQQLGDAYWPEAIGLLAADPELVDRCTTAELRKRGSGVMAAMIGLRGKVRP